MAKITYQQLVDHGACYRSRVHFREIFGDEVELTLDLALQHHKEFDVYWCGRHLLNQDEWEAGLIKLEDAYDEARQPHSEAILSKLAELNDSFMEHGDINRFRSEERQAYSVWRDAIRPLDEKLDRDIVALFVEMYNAAS